MRPHHTFWFEKNEIINTERLIQIIERTEYFNLTIGTTVYFEGDTVDGGTYSNMVSMSLLDFNPKNLDEYSKKIYDKHMFYTDILSN